MEPILADAEANVLYVTHLNHTLKALLAAAVNADGQHRKWNIIYKHVVIGSVRIKNDRVQTV